MIRVTTKVLHDKETNAFSQEATDSTKAPAVDDPLGNVYFVVLTGGPCAGKTTARTKPSFKIKAFTIP